jgi:hypothetical protein
MENEEILVVISKIKLFFKVLFVINVPPNFFLVFSVPSSKKGWEPLLYILLTFPPSLRISLSTLNSLSPWDQFNQSYTSSFYIHRSQKRKKDWLYFLCFRDPRAQKLLKERWWNWPLFT